MRRKPEGLWAWILILISAAFLVLMLIAPLAVVLTESLREGLKVFRAAISDFYAVRALYLTLEVTLVTVILNTLFGVVAAWALTRFNFRGKRLLITIIDIPFAVSPVIAGLIFILTFGRMSALNPWLQANDIKVVFAIPGIVLATVFVTFPFVAREIIPVLEARGTEEEEAAVLMGAGLFTIFWRVTFPHLRWALLYSVILCTARAMGEFGAVSVVSGRLRGKTLTLPLHVEILYDEYHFGPAFAVASLLVMAAVVILAARNLVEWLAKKERR
ncbi:MAG: sulfate ABC transporter permease subunit CysW [Planctomycetota bacterium]|jgi:sulfate transport system permease protein|nr:sulfate ABC transporter permease subunit CysW [Planctomycetota bacterium]